MGAYVNPKEGTKEKWLSEHGELVSMSTPFSDITKGKMAVIHMDNGGFTTAGIAYDSGEFDAFTKPIDNRPKSMFLVDVKKLHDVSPELKGYMAESPSR